MKIRNHSVVGFAFHSYFCERKGINSNPFFPKGWCFSLSALSVRRYFGGLAESEKGNLLCVLGVSSAAGGETIQSTRTLYQIRIRINVNYD
jgi:hypothetical protein